MLPSNVVYGILEDKEGYLWITTIKGILMYNPATSEKRIFVSSDGLPNYTFNLYNQIDKDDIIWWGSENGLIYCDPTEVRSSYRKERDMVITSMVIAGKEMPLLDDEDKQKVTPEYLKTLRLPSIESNITFYLSQLSYAMAKGLTNIYS